MTSAFYNDARGLLLTLCRGLHAHAEPVGEYGMALRCPHCGVLHTRAAEAVVAFAAAYRLSGETQWADAARRLGHWAIDQQRSNGAWIESEDNPWQGISIFILLALATAYRLLTQTAPTGLDQTDRARWCDAITHAAEWALQIRSTTHIGQARAAALRRSPWPGRGRHGQFWNTNYLATLPLALYECGQVLGRDFSAQERSFLSAVLERLAPDGLLGGEVNEPAPGWAKPFRRTDAIDPGYNLDMSLGVLALYAHHRSDAALTERIAASAAAHLPLFYPDGSIDNGMGARGYKAACWGSQTAHGLQMLAAGLHGLDACFARAGQRNIALLTRCLDNDLLHRSPVASPADPPCLYASFARAANLALALQIDASQTSTRDTALPYETAPSGLWRLPSLNSVVLREGPWMMTASGQRRDSSRLPFRFVTPATGGTLTRLHHDRFGPVQMAGFALYQRIEASHMPAGGLACPAGVIEIEDGCRSMHDRRVVLESSGAGHVTASGRLRKRRLWQRGAAYRIRYHLDANRLTKQVSLDAHASHHELIEPLVVTPGTHCHQESESRVVVQREGMRLHIDLVVEAGDCRLDLGAEIVPYSPPLPVRPLHLYFGNVGAQAARLSFTVQEA